MARDKMAACYLPCALFVCLTISAVARATHVKGLICQDPDTNKLYPVNSTWRSVSFCGNYTCKLRQTNVTQTEYAPINKKNNTSLDFKHKTLSNDMDLSPSEQAFSVIKRIQSVQQPVFHKESINTANARNDQNKARSTDTDRYLTESEIKSITEILHTVKKSDLEAIVEIYNIAQDIYKEMDTNLEEKKIKDTDINTSKPKEDNKKILKAKESVSYWYEPLEQGNAKLKPTDLKVEGTNSVPTARRYSYPATYFSGPLTDRDFRKLPYYYPMSNYQRTSPYAYNTETQNFQYNAPRQAKPCRKRFNNVAPTWVNTHINNFKDAGKWQMMQPVLLPYPFSYVQHYNFSSYPTNFYYSTYPWAPLNADYRKINNYPQQHFGAYISQIPNDVVNAYIKEAEENHSDVKVEEATKNTESKEVVDSPEWRTEELSAKVLEEVKANILENSKLLKPLNVVKNVKVGKVVKLDELTRRKRDTSNIDNKDAKFKIVRYEPYIEKTTCESSTELGYFRLGDPNEPYPACCPQKIYS